MQNVEIKYNGKTYTLPSHIEHKDENLIKIRLVHDDGMGEGIWAWIHPKDKADYEADGFDDDYERVAVLANQSLVGVPWGAYVPYRLDGDNRPESICHEVIDFKNDSPQFSPDAEESFKNSKGV